MRAENRFQKWERHRRKIRPNYTEQAYLRFCPSQPAWRPDDGIDNPWGISRTVAGSWWRCCQVMRRGQGCCRMSRPSWGWSHDAGWQTAPTEGDNHIRNWLFKVTRSGSETTLQVHVVAAILRMLRDPRTLPVCSSIMIGEYPVRTRLVN